MSVEQELMGRMRQARRLIEGFVLTDPKLWPIMQDIYNVLVTEDETTFRASNRDIRAAKVTDV